MRTVCLLIIYTFIVILAIPVLFISYLLRSRKPLIIIGKSAVWLGRFVLGIRLEISGREKFDKEKSYVFMPNHLSLLDGPLMFMLIPQKTSVIIKKEALKIPIIGLAMRLAKFVPVDRKGLRGGKESIEKAVQLMKKEGFSFLIFPEGTRSRNGKLQSFKRGGFFLAFSSQTPIVPVSIKGTYELQPKTTFFIKKGKVKVTFHEPISVEGCNVNSIPVLMDKVWNVVKKGLDSV